MPLFLTKPITTNVSCDAKFTVKTSTTSLSTKNSPRLNTLTDGIPSVSSRNNSTRNQPTVAKSLAVKSMSVIKSIQSPVASPITFNRHNCSQLIDQKNKIKTKSDTQYTQASPTTTCSYLKPLAFQTAQIRRLQRSSDGIVLSTSPKSSASQQKPAEQSPNSCQCTCSLCQTERQYESFEIIPKNMFSSCNEHNEIKIQPIVHYSQSYSQMTSLRLYNLMNTDCMIHYGNTDSTIVQSSGVDHLNSNLVPIYDPRYLYLIDCRPDRKRYEQHHINTAVHCEDLINETIYLSPPVEYHTIIVCYDDDGTHLEALVKISLTDAVGVHTVTSQDAHSHQQRRKSTTLFKRSQTENILVDLRRHLNSFKGTLYILTNGYEKFQSIYPFMCSDRQIRSTVDRNKYLTVYPNSVMENFLYIGSGIQAKNWKIIRDLNITHIINCSIEHECVFQDVCKYLHVKVEDNLNENIYDELDRAHLFIEKAFDTFDIGIVKGQYVKEPKILIHCNLGISRSSSILIAYIIKKYKFCLKSTINYVRDKRIQVAPNCNFLRQLKLYEEVVL